MKSNQSTYHRDMTPYELNQLLIDFYKSQYLKFLKIGINGQTNFGVTVTKKLIRSTENRLDQLIKGKKTNNNTCDIEKGIYRLGNNKIGQLFNSNRSFVGHITSSFKLKDLELIQQHAVCNYMDYSDVSPYGKPKYIDKITTAYNSETMRAVLSHDN